MGISWKRKRGYQKLLSPYVSSVDPGPSGSGDGRVCDDGMVRVAMESVVQ